MKECDSYDTFSQANEILKDAYVDYIEGYGPDTTSQDEVVMELMRTLRSYDNMRRRKVYEYYRKG